MEVDTPVMANCSMSSIEVIDVTEETIHEENQPDGVKVDLKNEGHLPDYLSEAEKDVVHWLAVSCSIPSRKHSSTARFPCPECYQDFGSSRNLQCHMTQHTKGKKYLCIFCFEEYGSDQELLEHSVVHLKKKEYFPCTLCTRVCSTKYSWEKHMMLHPGGSNFSGPVCSTELEAPISETHPRDCNSEMSEVVFILQDFQQPDCGSSVAKIARVVPEIEPKEEPNCSTTSINCIDGKEEIIHEENQSIRAVVDMEEDAVHSPAMSCSSPTRECSSGVGIACPEYRQDFSRTDLQCNMSQRTKGMKYPCAFCSKEYDSDQELREHSVVHLTKSFPCMLCRTVCSSKNSLMEHLMLHAGDSIFGCPVCSKTNLSNAELEMHISETHLRDCNGEMSEDLQQPDCGSSVVKIDSLVPKIELSEQDHQQPDCGSSVVKIASLVPKIEFAEQDHQQPNCGSSVVKINYLVPKIELAEQDHQQPDCGSSVVKIDSLVPKIELAEQDFQQPDCGSSVAKIASVVPKIEPQKEPNCSMASNTCIDGIEETIHKENQPGECPSAAQFHCQECKRNFGSRSNLLCHLPQHTKGKKYHCVFCFKAYGSNQELSEHSAVHLRKSFRCMFCKRRYSSQDSLKNHLVIHADGKNFSCPICSKINCSSDYQQADCGSKMVKMARLPTEEPNSISSMDCFVLTEEIMDDENECSGAEVHQDVFKVNAHQSIGTQTIPSHRSNFTIRFTCPMCHRNFGSRSNLLYHMPRHIKGKKYLCGICFTKYDSEQELRKHRDVPLGERFTKYPCMLCETICPNRHCLIKHLMIHTGWKRYTCPMCLTVTPCKAQLEMHISKTHLIYCNKEMSESQVLQELSSHLSKYSKEGRYGCPLCKKWYTTKEQLLEHVTVHTNTETARHSNDVVDEGDAQSTIPDSVNCTPKTAQLNPSILEDTACMQQVVWPLTQATQSLGGQVVSFQPIVWLPVLVPPVVYIV